uniref:Major facilitator superfamily associated domain-containing protein n=1 Tax=Strigamia maritima TaxID=126957 RepID=T1J3H2_STRMM
MRLQINKRLLVIKAHYFFFFAALSCLMPFLPVYVQKLGLSKTSMSIIYFIMPLSTIIAKPLCGNLADWLRRHKSVFLGNLILMSISYFGISFVPNLNPVTQHFNATVTCSASNRTESLLCPINPIQCKPTGIFCGFLNSTSNESYTLISETEPDGCTNLSNIYSESSDMCDLTINCYQNCEDENKMHYLVLYTCMLISAMATGVAIALADTIAFHLSTQENVDYGISRLWGSIGWGLMAIVAGYVYTITNFGQVKTGLSPVFYIFLAICLADICVSTQLKIGELPKPKHMLKNLSGAICKPLFLVFTISVFVMGLMTGALWTFQMVYVDELGGDALLFGCIMGVQCFLGEIPMFIFADKLLKKIGHIQAMPVCIGCFAFRYICYSFLVNPWFILPLELINGITFGLFFAAVVSFASGNAPSGMTATMQGIQQGVYEGFGLGFGNLISGQMYAFIGGRAMYLYFGIAAGCFVLVYEVFVFVFSRFYSSLNDVSQGDKTEDNELKIK